MATDLAGEYVYGFRDPPEPPKLRKAKPVDHAVARKIALRLADEELPSDARYLARAYLEKGGTDV